MSISIDKISHVKNRGVITGHIMSYKISAKYAILKDNLSKLLESCHDVDEAISLCKKNYPKGLSPFTLVYLSLNENKYILDHNFDLITLEEIKSLEFIPYVKFDVDDIREVSVKPLREQISCCRDKNKLIEIVKQYIKKPYLRFKKWETAPNKIFLYYAYKEKPIEFEIKYLSDLK